LLLDPACPMGTISLYCNYMTSQQKPAMHRSLLLDQEPASSVASAVSSASSVAAASSAVAASSVTAASSVADAPSVATGVGGTGVISGVGVEVGTGSPRPSVRLKLFITLTASVAVKPASGASAFRS